MKYIWALCDECHGIIGYYANEDKAKVACKANARLYGIDPEIDPLECDSELFYVWGWEVSYIKKVKVIE